MAHSPRHDELLQEAVAAHEEYLASVKAAKLKRQKVFARALSGTVVAREIGEAIGMSHSHVTKISKGLA